MRVNQIFHWLHPVGITKVPWGGYPDAGSELASSKQTFVELVVTCPLVKIGHIGRNDIKITSQHQRGICCYSISIYYDLVC